jgi:predicted transcriptional regulator of viral defense system
MEKQHKSSTDYIMKKLFSHELYYFSSRDFANIFDLPFPKAYNIIQRLEGKGLVKMVEKGKYLLLGYEGEKILANPMFIATKIVYPSYVSYWSALNFYGFTEQVPTKLLLATTKKKKEISFDGQRFRYIKVKPHKFFGYKRELLGGLDFLIAEKEKAIVDSLDQPSYAGGMSEVAKSLTNGLSEMDVERLQEYALAMKNKSLCSRLGYLLERLGGEVEGLLSNISKGYILLDPERERSNSYDKRWRINENMEGI